MAAVIAHGTNLGVVDSDRRFGRLEPLFRARVDAGLIAEQWDPLVRIAASLKQRTAKSQEIMRRLGGSGRSDRTSKALTALGRIIKTIHILRYICDEELRDRIQLQLNRGENRHALARHLFFGRQGEFRKGDYEEVMNKASCLSLLSNAVAAWNIEAMGAIVRRLRESGQEVPDEHLARVWPLNHGHVVQTPENEEPDKRAVSVRVSVKIPGTASDLSKEKTMTTTCRRTAILACLLGVLVGGSVSSALAEQTTGETNPLFTETKVKNYLPHMTWKQAEEALQRTDMVIIPVGSIEQHGTHLPLCSDIYDAIEVAKLIAQETDVLVAPAVFAGLSEHHMGFPGTVTLSPETFEAVVFETAQSLIAHGIRKVMIYNGHGGNTASVTRVIHKINQTTLATAINLGDVSPPEDESEEEIPFDWHAGEVETSLMLYLTPGLADMSQARKPVLTFPPIVQQAQQSKEKNLEDVAMASIFLPKKAGKGATTRDMSDTGAVTSGDPRKATAERGRRRIARFVEAAVQFIEEWKRVTAE